MRLIDADALVADWTADLEMAPDDDKDIELICAKRICRNFIDSVNEWPTVKPSAWHDLKMNPWDLPTEHETVFCCFNETGVQEYSTAYLFRDFKGDIHWVGYFGWVPIAWKRLERFVEEDDGEKD